MQMLSGKLVRLNVPQWFRDPEFQTWFNERLGRGLATWRHATDPLESCNITSAACKVLADALHTDVISADVLFEPIGVGSICEIEGESKRLEEAEEALSKVHDALKEASEKEGLTPELAQELRDLLDDKVLSADVLFEPGAIADPDVLEEEHQRLERAENTLGIVNERLRDCARKGLEEELFVYSDCFVGVDGGLRPDGTLSGEGTDSDMPERFWNVVVDAAKEASLSNPDNLHIIVWLSPEE